MRQSEGCARWLLVCVAVALAGCPKPGSGEADAGPDSGADPIIDLDDGGELPGQDGGPDAGSLCSTPCGGDTPVCDVQADRCVQCLGDGNCSGATPTCDLDTLTCVPPNGETCAGALSVAVSAGQSTTFTVDTTGRRNDLVGSCNGDTPGGDAELIYRLAFSQPQDLTVTAKAQAGSNADPVLYVRKTFCDIGAELRCVDFPGSTDTLKLLNLEAGSYYLVVESWNGTAGPIDVTVTLSGPTAQPPNETCTAPEVLDLASGTATLRIDSAVLTDDHQGGCNDTPASTEAVYALSLAQEMNVSVTATASNGTEPVLYLRGTCASGPDEVCSDPSGNTSTISKARVPPGTWYLFVEADGSGMPGIIDAQVTVAPTSPPPANDTCSAPAQLSFVSGSAAFQVDVAQANDDHTGTCNSSANSPEAVYAFTLSQPQDVFVTARGLNGASPVLYLGQLPCGSGSERACVNRGGPVSELAAYNLQPATYFLFVETANGGVSLPIDVEVSLAPPSIPPANDSCATAQTLSLTQGVPQTIAVNTHLATNDAAGTCNQDTASGDHEVVYKVSLSQPQDLKVTAVGTSLPAADPVLYVRSASCSSGTERACADGVGAKESLHLRNLTAGDYFVFVETWNGLSGRMNVTFALEPPAPPPANDTCAAAVPLSLPASVSGSTHLAANDYQGCGDSSGGDVVYTFNATAAGTLRATVSPTGGAYRPTLYLRDGSSCASGALGCVQASGVGQAGELVVENLAAGTYFLIVDGAGSTRGDYNLDVQLDPPVSPAQNDACTNATVLAFSGGRALTTGTTSQAANDVTNASCAPSSGPDVFYRFTTPASGSVNARVRLTSANSVAYRPLVNLRSGCGATNELVCAVGLSAPWEAGGITAGLSPSTDYFVVVDSDGAGPFHLQVDVAPVPAANDACASAQPLPANTSLSGTTLGASNEYAGGSGWYTGSQSCTDTFDGADVVYAFTAASSGPVTVRVQPDSGFDVGLAVLSSCQLNHCVATSDVGLGGDPEALTFIATAGTTYYVVVDSLYAGTSEHARGGFVISSSP